VTPGLTLDTFAQQLLEGESPRSAVTVRRGERIVGLVGISQLRRLRRSRWPQIRVEDVMIPRDRIPALAPEIPIWPAFLRLRAAGLDAGLVGDPDSPAGLLTVRAIAAALEARRLGGGQLGSRP
jgi:CBS domain-containing protein